MFRHIKRIVPNNNIRTITSKANNEEFKPRLAPLKLFSSQFTSEVTF